MSKFSDAKAVIPIEAVIEVLGGEVLDVRRSGWAKARCPLHRDRHPSAAVSPGSDYFLCSSCGERGDIFELLILADKADTPSEALEWLKTAGFLRSSTADSS